MKFNLNSIVVLSVIFIVSCSMENESTAMTDQGPIYQGPFYNEFVACSPGPQFSQELVAEMLSAWDDLDKSENLLWAGIYAPKGDSNKYDNGWWELMWNSKEEADAAWEEWSSNPDAQAWNEKYSAVVNCDGEGRFAWTFYLPRVANSFGEVEDPETGYFASEFMECSFNEGKKPADLRANVVEYNNYLDNLDNQDPYFFGVYYPTFEYEDADVLWGNWHKNFETMAAGQADWEENGQEMLAKFNETVTCNTSDYYDSYMLLNNTEE